MFVLVNSSDVLVTALRQGLLEVAVGRLPADADPADFVTAPLREEPWCFVARVGHPWARRRALRAADFDDASWIVPPYGGLCSKPSSTGRGLADIRK